jgi:hypothetical protein
MMLGIFLAWPDKGMTSTMKQIWPVIGLKALYLKIKIVLAHALTAGAVSGRKVYIATSSLLGARPGMEVGL